MSYFITAIIALFASFICAPLVRRVAFKLDAVQVPKDERGASNVPIALLGGVAMIVGFLVACAYSMISGGIEFDRTVAGLLGGIAVLVACGYLDDRHTLSWKQKLLFQLAAALIYVLMSDMQIGFLTNPFAYDEVVHLPAIVTWPMTILWLVGITNAINFIDGLDGLATGVSCISALSLFFVSVLAVEATQNASTPVFLAAIAGATLGFLPYNFNPARIFMGETGAAFLGFTLAAVSLQGMLKSFAAITLTVPVLVIGLPIFNVAFASIRRILRKASPATGDKSHIHDTLINMGLTQRQSVLILYIASAVLGLIGFVFANKHYLSAATLLILLPMFLFVFVKFFLGKAADDGNGNSNGVGNGNGVSNGIGVGIGVGNGDRNGIGVGNGDGDGAIAGHIGAAKSVGAVGGVGGVANATISDGGGGIAGGISVDGGGISGSVNAPASHPIAASVVARASTESERLL